MRYLQNILKCSLLIVFIVSCRTYMPTESRKFIPEFGIDVLLVDGRPIDSLWVRLSYDILEAQSNYLPVYDSALIVVYCDSFSDTLIADSILPNCFSSINRNRKIKTGETYNLFAKIFKNKVDTLTMTSFTTVPDSVYCLPMASKWAFDTSIISEVISQERDPTKLVNPIDSTLNFQFLVDGDTGYYMYNDELKFYSYLLLSFFPNPLTINGEMWLKTPEDTSSLVTLWQQMLYEYSLSGKVADPSLIAKLSKNPSDVFSSNFGGILVEYEWGDSIIPWDSLQFVMQTRGPRSKNIDSTGYYEDQRVIERNIFHNDELSLSMIFTGFSTAKYLGKSAFNIYAVDKASYDFHISRGLRNTVSNIKGGSGIFGSASIQRIPFYLKADSLLITNAESKIIEEEKENRQMGMSN